jgi:hypothetical protein
VNIFTSLSIALLLSGCAASSGSSNASSPQPPQQAAGPGSAVRSGSASTLVVSNTAFDQCPIKAMGKPLVIIKTEANWKKSIGDSSKDIGELRNWQPRFNQQLVAVYSVGRKTSLGFKPELVRSETAFATGTTDLYLKQKRPAAGTMQAMVMTEPCIIALINLDKSNHAPQVIRVIDQDTGATLSQTASVDPEFTF